MEDFNRHDTKDSWTPDSSYSAQYSSYPIQAHVDRELNKRKNFSSISFNHHDQASYSESLTSRGRKR